MLDEFENDPKSTLGVDSKSTLGLSHKIININAKFVNYQLDYRISSFIVWSLNHSIAEEKSDYYKTIICKTTFKNYFLIYVQILQKNKF
ncbi:hypothetical protein BpHYR1_052928 [Brachionus plicatilis]|uniref:Uncharacterized protein n=1 Tax=Brachionus plicatilis TaxID=10195 RepID=A0A3M7S977_BRAPC|nr:hypothetical protein BpHYR1_052928 [Brachionus plicatilis]